MGTTTDSLCADVSADVVADGYSMRSDSVVGVSPRSGSGVQPNLPSASARAAIVSAGKRISASPGGREASAKPFGALRRLQKRSGLTGFDVVTEETTDRAGSAASSVTKAASASRQRQRKPRGRLTVSGAARGLLVVARHRRHHEASSIRVSVPVAFVLHGVVEAQTPMRRAAAGSDRGYARERGCFGRIADPGSIPGSSTKSPPARSPHGPVAQFFGGAS